MSTGVETDAYQEWITPEEAAMRLGVKRDTVYAYISRGRLRSKKSPTGSGTVLDASHVERLVREGKSTRRTSPRGMNESSLSLIRQGRLYYRGRDAAQLARTAPFESVAALLWDVPHMPWEPAEELVDSCRTVFGQMPIGTLPIDLLRLHESLITVLDPSEPHVGRILSAARARRVLMTMISALPARSITVPTEDFHDDAAVVATIWSRLSPHEARVDDLELLNAALIILADHDLAPGTVAVRSAARAGVDVGSVIRLGMDSGTGIIKGAAALAIEAFLRELRSAGAVEAALTRRVRQGEPVPGFGHSVYPDGDPRAALILSMLRDCSVDSERMEIVDTVLDIQERRGLPAPNAGFALAALAFVRDMIPGAGEAIFVLSRAVGWVAHALEAAENGRARREHSVYVGPPPRETRATSAKHE